MGIHFSYTVVQWESAGIYFDTATLGPNSSSYEALIKEPFQHFNFPGVVAIQPMETDSEHGCVQILDLV